MRSPRLLFSAQLPEVLDVPPDCPRACSNPRCSCHGCACLNPWAAHSGATRCGSSGPARHFKCSSGPAEGPVLEEGGAACRVGGERYAVGGLAFFVPPGVELEGRQALDVELELVRPGSSRGYCCGLLLSRAGAGRCPCHPSCAVTPPWTPADGWC